MKYLAVAGRQPLISLAEIQALYDKHAKLVGRNLIIFQLNNKKPEIDRLGGTMKLGELFDGDFKGLVKHLNELHPEGKITFGISDFSKQKKTGFAFQKSMEIKLALRKMGRSVRVITSKEPEIPSATAHHNQLGEKPGCYEILVLDRKLYLSLGTQNITAYTERSGATSERC